MWGIKRNDVSVDFQSESTRKIANLKKDVGGIGFVSFHNGEEDVVGFRSCK
jgi:hypothetical protein